MPYGLNIIILGPCGVKVLGLRMQGVSVGDVGPKMAQIR